MSTVRADNFGNRLGTSSIPAHTLLQGTAKAWLNLNGVGTIVARDSFNVSSLVDGGVGIYSANLITSFANANYPISPGGYGVGHTTMHPSNINTASRINLTTYIIGSSPALFDADYAFVAAFGAPT